ncbi:unnamed protein product, partial [Symbiodinium necroappetens]
MVDYSKFDKIAVDSSDSDDAAAVCAPTRPAGQPRSLGRSSSAKQQQEDFAYPTRGQGIVSFDIRDEACRRHGYLHGDVVITENGRVSTAIGVYDDMLWFHVEGSDGAGIWVNETLKKIGRTTLRPGASKEAPTLASEWLNLDFLYTAGVTVSSAEVVPFDIRDEICMSVGGFKHGQVLEVPGIRKPVVTIGVRRDRFCMALWFHVKGSPGAGRFEEGVLGKARVKGHQAKDGGESAESQRLLEQLQAERRARQEAEAEVKNLRKKLEKLRASNASLIKSTSNSERQAVRKDRMKRDVIASEVEAETKERLMVELVRPKLAELADLRQEQESVQRRLQNNVLDTQRLREELERREREALRLRQEATRLHQAFLETPRHHTLGFPLLFGAKEALRLEERIEKESAEKTGWTPYSGAVSAHLMDAYIKGTSNVTVSCEGRSYQVDFTLQMQLNLSTMKRRRIRCNLGLPKHWQMSNEEGLKLIRGEPLSDQDSVISGGISVRTRLTTISEAAVMAMQVPFKRHVIKISEAETLEELEGLLNKLLEAYQVRNPYLWRRFQRFGRTIRDKQLQFGITPEGIQPPVGHALAKLAKRLDVDVDRNERLLFHGTKHFGYAKAIATEGFDNRVAKEGLYGNGTYFAAQTCKSAQYAARGAMTGKVSSHRPGTINVARVALGDPFYTAGAYDGSRPPTKSFNHSDSDDSDQEDARDIICDSLIARPGIKRGNLEQSHMEIVTFAPEQAYPEFILRFAEDCRLVTLPDSEKLPLRCVDLGAKTGGLRQDTSVKLQLFLQLLVVVSTDAMTDLKPCQLLLCSAATVDIIYPNPIAFAAKKSDGSVVTWGDSQTGGDSSSVKWRTYAPRKVLQAMETIVPSSRSNAPQQLDFNFDTCTLGDMMNAVFWKKIGDLGIELGHNEASGGAALADGPPPRRPPLPRRRQQSRSRRDCDLVPYPDDPANKSSNSTRRDERRRARSPPTREAGMSQLQRGMLEHISKEAEHFQVQRTKFKHVDVRDIETSSETINSATYLDLVHDLQLGRQVDTLPPLVVIKFVETAVHVAVFGNTCVVFEDVNFLGEEKVLAPLAGKLVLQSEDQMACLHRFLANKRHAANDPAETGSSVLHKFKDNVRVVDVKDIRHSHDAVNMHFAHGAHKGQSVQTLVEDLISGKLTPRDITPLVLLELKEGEYWTIFGNRKKFGERKRHPGPVLMDCLVWDKAWHSKTLNDYAAVKGSNSDGSAVTWGSSDWGRDSGSVSSHLTSGSETIYSNGLAFAAKKSDGIVVTWGDAKYGGALVDLLWDSEDLRGPDSFLWALAAAGISEAEVIHEACVEVATNLFHGEDPGSFGRLSRVLWSMETLGASSRQVCRSMSRRLLQEINGAELEEIAMVVWPLVSGDADLSTAAAIQRRVESQLRQLRRTSPSGLIFQRLGISVMGIAGSFAMAGRLPRSFRASLQKALLQTGIDLDKRSNVKMRTSLLHGPSEHDDMSATVVWDQPDRAVFFKPPGWEVYGAHTNRQMSSFAASHFGNWVAEAEGIAWLREKHFKAASGIARNAGRDHRCDTSYAQTVCWHMKDDGNVACGFKDRSQLRLLAPSGCAEFRIDRLRQDLRRLLRPAVPVASGENHSGLHLPGPWLALPILASNHCEGASRHDRTNDLGRPWKVEPNSPETTWLHEASCGCFQPPHSTDCHREEASNQ